MGLECLREDAEYFRFVDYDNDTINITFLTFCTILRFLRGIGTWEK
jgi:hypothetical protein